MNRKRRVQTDENKCQYVSFNFISNDYHHHCCSSNEQSFKSKTSFSTSIESLLTLFAIVFISCYQIIIVKSLFNLHQVDLLSRNLFFIHISSVSSLLIILFTIRYMIFMSASKFLKILHFDEYNITEFLERFEKQCNEYKIIKKKQ